MIQNIIIGLYKQRERETYEIYIYIQICEYRQVYIDKDRYINVERPKTEQIKDKH